MARGPQLITIFWRDIPAQVNGKERGAKHQVLLKPRFQKAIDRAAMVAGITTSSAYVAEWRQVATAVSGDVVAAAEAEAERLDEAFVLARLDQFVATGGWDPDSPPPETPSSDSTNEDSVNTPASSGELP